MPEYKGGIDRRRSARVCTNKDAVAFNGKKYGRIVDASLHGLCFQYAIRRKADAERNDFQCRSGASLDIVVGSYNFSLVNLPVQVVADYRVAVRANGESVVSIRRRAVTFEALSQRQIFQLKRFLLLNLYGDGTSYEFKTMQKESKWILDHAAQR